MTDDAINIVLLFRGQNGKKFNINKMLMFIIIMDISIHIWIMPQKLSQLMVVVNWQFVHIKRYIIIFSQFPKTYNNTWPLRLQECPHLTFNDENQYEQKAKKKNVSKMQRKR